MTEGTVFFIHSPSIPMTLKDPNNTASNHAQSLDTPTLDPAHEAILEMHAHSESSALFYVVVVLVLYVIALVAVLSKYLSTERYDNRLRQLYDQFISRDRFVNRVADKRDSQQCPTMDKDLDKLEEQKQSLVVKMILCFLSKYLSTDIYDNRFMRLYDKFLSIDRLVNRMTDKNDLNNQQCSPMDKDQDKVVEQKQSLVVMMVNSEFVL